MGKLSKKSGSSVLNNVFLVDGTFSGRCYNPVTAPEIQEGTKGVLRATDLAEISASTERSSRFLLLFIFRH